MIEIAKDSTGNTATFQILDSDGAPDTGVAYNAAGLVVFYTPHGGTQVVITLSVANWHEKGNGWYEVDVADAVYTSVRVLDFGGVITDGHVIGERQSVVEDLYSEAGVQAAAAAAIAAAKPIDANVTQVAGVTIESIDNLKQDVRDAMGLTSTSGEDSIDDKLANKTGYSLSATGLDAIADPDHLTPGSVPTTFSEKLRWLIQRFWKAEKSATVITVTNEAGDTITNQSVTSSGTNETLGAPE